MLIKISKNFYSEACDFQSFIKASLHIKTLYLFQISKHLQII